MEPAEGSIDQLTKPRQHPRDGPDARKESKKRRSELQDREGRSDMKRVAFVSIVLLMAAVAASSAFAVEQSQLPASNSVPAGTAKATSPDLVALDPGTQPKPEAF